MKHFIISLSILIWVIIFHVQISVMAQPVNKEKLFIELIRPVTVEQEKRQDEQKLHDATEPDFSRQIDEATAKKAALSFLTSVSGCSQLKSTIGLELTYKAVVPNMLKSNSTKTAKEAVCYYIFSSSKANMFVIVSGDNRVLPILGYSNTSSFDPENCPPGMKTWLNMYKNEIQHAINKDLKTSNEVKKQWLNLFNGENINTKAIVAPMLKTHWDQIPPYNSHCPYDSTLNERALGGCTSTAMAQIMKYWEYPASGIGSNSYISESHPELGVITADFENTEYDWASMPNSISVPNTEIGRLIFQCGVSTNMNYGVSSLGGSNAKQFDFNHPSVLMALRKYFGYKHTNSCKVKSFYDTNSKWLEIIKAELDANRPVFYGADEDDEEGHSFVCDGYDSNNFLHFNWGWGGLSDGYFATEAIDLGYRDYTSQQEAIVGIEPLSINPGPDIQFNSKVAVSPAVYLKPGQAFSVTVDFKNLGAVAFEGNFSAEVINASGQWVATVNTSNKYTLATGENTGPITFSSDGISTLSPGTYFITFWKVTTQMKVIESSLSENGYTQMFKKIVISNDQEPVAADEFENNNTEATAYEFTPEFSDKISETKFTANIHTTSDVDYYKFKIPVGYRYTVAASIVEDGQAALGGAVFPLDGVFMYKLEDSSWSVPEDIYSEFNYTCNDGNFYFKFEPATMGNLGTYKISLKITQGDEITSSPTALAESSANVYPNPNNGRFTINLGNKNLGKSELTVFTINGQMVMNELFENPSEVTKDISLNVPNGIYLLRIRNDANSTTKKVIVNQ